MKKENKELTIEQETVRDCPILYQMRYRPMTETCMCWGFECGKGWMDIIQSASYELETLNATYYPKYRVRIQADQIKEKYGTLHFYHSVCVDHGKFLTWLLGSMQRFEDMCFNHDFKYKRVVDVNPYDYDETRIITKDEYEKGVKDKYKCSNVDYVKKGDNDYREIIHLRNYGIGHNEPTKNKLWWKLGNLVRRTRFSIDYLFKKVDTKDTRRLVNYMDNKALEIIRKAEEKCAKVCERCGTQIGTEWSPACETVGWVSYICDNCAKKGNSEYYIGKKLYYKGKLVKSNPKKSNGSKNG